jgi:hypothetical protein
VSDIDRRLENLEIEEEQTGDFLITMHEEQWTRGIDDVLIPVQRKPVGYSETKWTDRGEGRGRWGVRYAIYDQDKSLESACEIENN